MKHEISAMKSEDRSLGRFLDMARLFRIAISATVLIVLLKTIF